MDDKTLINKMKEKTKETLSEATEMENDNYLNDGESNSSKENNNITIPKFEDLAIADMLHPVPDYLKDQLLDSVNKVHNTGSFNGINENGESKRRFPKQDIYSGKIREITNNPIEFPARTKYGIDNYVVVKLNNGLNIYVPARQAGLKQPQVLTQMRNKLCSVVITDVFEKNLNKEYGNTSEMYAIGSIQYAEYQMGTQLRAEMVNNTEAFLNYVREGIISHIDRKREIVTITADLTNEQKGYIDIQIPFDLVWNHYKWQKITDVPELQEGNKINFKFTNIIEKEINNNVKNIKGTYFKIEASRKQIAGFEIKPKLVMNAGVRGDQLTGYLYGRRGNTGIRVEVAPGIIFEAGTAHRGVSRNLNITKEDVKNHVPVSYVFHHSIVNIALKEHDPDKAIKKALKAKTPIIITGIDHPYKDNQIAADTGTYSGPNMKEIEEVSMKLSKKSNKKISPVKKLLNELNQ